MSDRAVVLTGLDVDLARNNDVIVPATLAGICRRLSFGDALDPSAIQRLGARPVLFVYSISERGVRLLRKKTMDRMRS